MALNISKQIDSKPKNGSLTQDFMQKHKITVNEPVQTHFSVEGVQTYSADEIKAMKIRADRVNAQKDGTFIQPTAYKIDDEIDFGDRPNTQKQEFRTTFKAKSKKEQLEQAKPNNSNKDLNAPKRKVIKPSIRNQNSRTNQQSVKLTKNLQKKEILQQKMQELSNKYKKHFGNANKKQQKSNKQKSVQQEEEIQEDPQIELQEESGEQMLPSFDKKEKSTTTLAKTNKHKNQKVSHDDSFEQIQWAQPQKHNHNLSMSSSKAGAYSERLGDAVHFLFD